MMDFRPGSYRLVTCVTNPEARSNSEDWRHKPFFEAGAIFHGYSRYVSINREVPAFYQGMRPETAVTMENLPQIYRAIVPHLEATK